VWLGNETATAGPACANIRPVLIPRKSAFLFLLLDVCVLLTAKHSAAAPLPVDQPVRGWNILSDSEPDALAVIRASSAYKINHLQLSHSLVHNLHEVRDEARRAKVNRLIDAAHAAGIQEVVLWDHSLYDLDYYPANYRTGPDGTIDLDNPQFWSWLKHDYRQLLDLVPHADGLVLTFIETGARAERQHSAKLKTNQAKLAAVVNAVADVVIGERKLTIYARTFAYTHAEYENIIGAVNLFERPEIRLMMKETPHDFFLTHPNDMYAGRVARPTIIEFDIAGEFNGQGIIANTWPQYVLSRCRDLLARDHVIGYVARTDRYRNTRVIGRPSEINLEALRRYTEDPTVTAARVYEDFVASRYGTKAAPPVKRAFEAALDIVTSCLYTLGTNTANHSQLDYDPYASSYARHVSGKWFDPPVVRVGHGVDRELHYWKDIVNHLAPPWAKDPQGSQWREVPWVKEKGWITPGEEMTGEFLQNVLNEKDWGVKAAKAAVEAIEEAKPELKADDYTDLHHYFYRTLLTARVHRAAAGAYFGFRVWSRGGAYRTAEIERIVRDSLDELTRVAEEIKCYPVTPAIGQWNWSKDADRALRYHDWITKSGWPAETRGFKNPNGGMKLPMK